MDDQLVPSDVTVLDLMRKNESLTVAQLADLMGVTATAIRQRLTRLLAQGVVERVSKGSGRGRPSYFYQLSMEGRRKAGANFADLAVALWEEVRDIKDEEVRRGLLTRLARRMADQYLGEVKGNTPEERINSIAEIFTSKNIPFTVECSETQLPVLTAYACPYPGLAEQDRAVCVMERTMLEEIVGQPIELTKCRLNEGNCCTFEVH